MFMELNTIEKQLDEIDEAELGSEDRPARSCYDLKLEMPSAESGECTITIHLERTASLSLILTGMYFIDPNLGSPLDSIKTYCNFATSLTYTCVQVCYIWYTYWLMSALWQIISPLCVVVL